jgi:transposase
MSIYAGLDVSDKTTHICVVDVDGKVLRRDVVASDPDVLAKWLNRHCNDLLRVVLETGTLSTFLYHGLVERGVAIECICARHAKGVLSARVNKSDVHDADLCPVRAHQRSIRKTLDANHRQPTFRRMVPGFPRSRYDARRRRPPRSPLHDLRNERRQLPPPGRSGAQTARCRSAAKPSDNQRQRASVAPRQSTSNITLASDNQQEHISNNAVSDSDPD